MGKQIQIVGQNVRPVVLKELDLNANGIFTFLKPSEDDVVEVNNSEFIRAIKDIDTFNKWVVEYKRDENTIIPLRIDKIEKKVIEPAGARTLDISGFDSSNYLYDLDGNVGDGNTPLPYIVYAGGYWKLVSSPSGPYQFWVGLTNTIDNIPVLTPPPSNDNYLGVSSEYFESASYDADTKILTFVLVGEEASAVETDEQPKTEWHFSFTNDDVDVSAITLVKLEVVYTIEDDSIVATYVDETKEIEAGTVLPTPSGADDGKVLGVQDGAYALVEQSGGGSSWEDIILSNAGSTEGELMTALDPSTTEKQTRFINLSYKTGGNSDELIKLIISTNYAGGAWSCDMIIVSPTYLTKGIYLNYKMMSKSGSGLLSDLFKTFLIGVPPLPADTSVNYTLKYDGGTLAWVQGGGFLTGIQIPGSYFNPQTGQSDHITIAQFFEAVGIDLSVQSQGVIPFFTSDGEYAICSYSASSYLYITKFGRNQYGGQYIIGQDLAYNINDTSSYSATSTYTFYTSPVFVPALPNDADSKTYVLKAVDGAVQWVEETAQ